MEKPDLIIFTVGTSLLLGNKREYDALRHRVLMNLPDDKTEETIEKEINKEGTTFNDFLQELLGLNPDKEIDKRGPKYHEKKPDNLPAELSSLYLFYFAPENIPDSIPSKEPKDKVALIYSPDNKCIFCAYCIKKYLATKFSGMIDGVEMIRIDGLDPKDKEKFEREGVRELLGKISELIKKYKDSYNIILNVTGGYKGSVPYLTLFGMCQEGIEVIYLFEESKANITLPKMPVAFDIFTWRNYRGFIEAVPHLESKVAETILDNILPAQISSLFEEGGDNKHHLTKLGEILRENYREEKEGELTPYGRGYLLVDKINDDEKRKALQDCINRWQYLWLGDLIPETVEHARGHTQRVLELAAQILYPILDKEENFFDDKNKMDLFKPRDNNDEWVRDTTIFSEDLIEAIQLICCYHRGKMPVSQSDNKDGYVGIGVKNSLKELQSDLVDVPLMGALLRVADAGDVQEERTISKNYKAMRFLQIDREKETLKKEEEKLREKVEESKLPEYLKYLKETAMKYFDGENLELDDEYKKITSIINDEKKMNELKRIKKESPDHCNDALLDYLVDNCVQKYIMREDLKDSDDTDGLILRNWLSALDQYVFKKSPASHFEKHAGISAVMYLLDNPAEGKGKNEYHYKVRAIHKKDKDEKKRNKLIENAECVVLNDISKEYTKVKKILNDNRIFFDSYEMQEEGREEIIAVTFNDCR